MTEADFALMALIFGLLSFCGLGVILLFPSQIERIIDRWKTKHA